MAESLTLRGGATTTSLPLPLKQAKEETEAEDEQPASPTLPVVLFPLEAYCEYSEYEMVSTKESNLTTFRR